MTCTYTHVTGITITPVPCWGRPGKVSLAFTLTPYAYSGGTIAQDTIDCFGHALLDWPKYLIAAISSETPTFFLQDASGAKIQLSLKPALDDLDSGSIPGLWSKLLKRSLLTTDRSRADSIRQVESWLAYYGRDAVNATVDAYRAERPLPAYMNQSAVSRASERPRRRSASSTPTAVDFQSYLSALRNASKHKTQLYPGQDVDQPQPHIDTFQRFIAFAQRYPALLRPLGLVVDATFDASKLTASDATTLQVAMSQEFSSADFRDIVASIRPILNCEITTDKCVYATSRSNMIARGYYKFSKSAEAGEAPVSAATLYGLREDVMRHSSEKAAVTPLGPFCPTDDEDPRDPKTAGIVIYDDTIPTYVQAQADAHKTLIDSAEAYLQELASGQAPLAPAPPLYAEDLLRGFRIDIATVPDANTVGKDGEWRSLCQQKLHLTMSGAFGAHATVLDEGCVEFHSTVADDQGAPAMATHDAIFQWQNWSLCAPHPGDPLRSPTPPSASPPELPLEISVTVAPGTLPSLRFGNFYDVRMRALDITGNGPPLQIKGTAGLYPAEDETWVLSGPAKAAIHFQRWERVSPPAPIPEHGIAPRPGDAPNVLVVRDVGDSTRRFMLPPPTQATFAELHGSFDAGGSRVDSSAYTIMNTHEGFVPKTYWAPDIGFATLPLGYLCDPVVTSVIVEVDGHDPIELTFSGKWPNYTPWTIELLGDEQSADPVPDTFGLNLPIRLAPGEMRCVRVSSGFVKDGRFFAPVASVRHLQLIHALERVPTPTLTKSVVDRKPNDHSAQPTFTFTSFSRSVGRVDVVAWWADPIDDGISADGVTYKDTKVPVGEKRYLADAAHDGHRVEVDSVANVSINQTFPDTKHHVVDYQLSLTTKFNGFFEESPPATTLVAHAVCVPNAAVPPPPIVHGIRPLIKLQPSAEGTVSTLKRLGHAVRVWLERPWFSTGDGEQLAIILDTPDSMQSQKSRAARDLVYNSLPAANTKAQIIIGDIAGNTLPATTYNNFTIVPIDVTASNFNRDRGLYFADFVVGVDETQQASAKTPSVSALYLPFIRLGLARYQPCSVDTLGLSAVATADIIQLLPERLVTITKSASFSDPLHETFDVKIDFGAQPEQYTNAFEVRLEQSDGRWWNPLEWNAKECYPVGDDGSVSIRIERFFRPPYRLAIYEYENQPLRYNESSRSGRRLVYVDTLRI